MNGRASRNLVVVMVVLLTISASIAVYEYAQAEEASSTLSAIRAQGEIVYNLPGVAIPVVCCPKISSSFIIGDYSFATSEVSPVPSAKVNGVAKPAAPGVQLIILASPLGQSTETQNATFSWYGSFNESVPYPSHSDLFGGRVDFYWYVEGGLLFMHVEAGQSITQAK